jgi:sortase A
MNALIRWLPRALFACSALALAWCAFALVESRTFQRTVGDNLNQTLALERASTLVLPPAVPGLVGRVEIARLGVAVIVMEGTSAATLRHAAGHIAGTAMPGEPGNTAISAHRDTFFRPLRHVRVDDQISFTTPEGNYQYRVSSATVTSPADIAVLQPTSTETLTLVTCFPFYFVGPAPERFIVRAERIH